jgi:hypothetical protein
MRTIVARVCTAVLIVLFMAPAAMAQDDAMAESAEKAKHHVHHGTMTPPGASTAMDITYELSMADGEHSGWIVANSNGQEMRIEMMDLAMDHESVSYYWSPPGSDLIITCELTAADEGGWAGECTDNEDGGVGLMSMAPMSMDHDADHEGDHDADHEGDYDKDHDADHDDADDHDDDEDEDEDD